MKNKHERCTKCFGEILSQGCACGKHAMQPLCDEDRDAFLAMMKNPPPPNRKLTDMMAYHGAYIPRENIGKPPIAIDCKPSKECREYHEGKK